MPLVVNIDDAVMDDLSGDEFELGAKWDIEGADDDDICIEDYV